jgi:hypothetical protein
MISSWSVYNACTKSCAKGTKTRVRSILTHIAHGGCKGYALSDTISCNPQACPIDCKVSQWTADWSTCSEQCGGGLKFKTRSVVTYDKNNGVECPATKKAMNCNTHPCPIDCLFEFKPWTACSKSCTGQDKADGIQWRYVVVMTEPAHGGDECPYRTSRTCNTEVCPTPSPTTYPTSNPTPPPTPAYSKPYFNKGTMHHTVEANLKGGKNTFYNGIECHDKVWGDLTKVIKTSGFKADYSKLGGYSLQYDCRNPAPWKVAADPIFVKVQVVDTTTPVCKAKATVSIEASFPYVPTGASCTDSIDGKLGVQFSGFVNVEMADTYHVTYSATDKSGNVGEFVQAVKVIDTLKPTIGLKIGHAVIHASGATDTGIGGQKNPAHGYFGSFMAEGGSSAMPLVAMAAAAFGVALLAAQKPTKTELEVLV